MNRVRTQRVALVGLGYASDFHLPAVLSHPALRLVAVCDRDRGRLAAVARRFAVEAVSDPRQLLDRSDIDVVGILTPPTSHLEIAIPALASGKHLILEKPITATLDEADQMIAAASVGRLAIRHLLSPAGGHVSRFFSWLVAPSGGFDRR